MTKKTVNPSAIKGWRSFCCPIFGSVGHGNIHVIYRIAVKLNWYFVDCSYQFRRGFSQVDLGGDSLLRMTFIGVFLWLYRRKVSNRPFTRCHSGSVYGIHIYTFLCKLYKLLEKTVKNFGRCHALVTYFVTYFCKVCDTFYPKKLQKQGKISVFGDFVCAGNFVTDVTDLYCTIFFDMLLLQHRLIYRKFFIYKSL